MFAIPSNDDFFGSEGDAKASSSQIKSLHDTSSPHFKSDDDTMSTTVNSAKVDPNQVIKQDTVTSVNPSHLTPTPSPTLYENSPILQGKRLDLSIFARGEGSRVRITTRLPHNLHDRLTNFATLNSLSLNTAITLLLDIALDSEGVC